MNRATPPTRSHGAGYPKEAAGQRGFGTLATGILLLFAITLVSFSSARTALQETRMTNNQLLSAQSQSAAEAALAYAIAVLPDQTINWEATEHPGEEAAEQTLNTDSGAPVAVDGATIRYIRNGTAPDYVRVSAEYRSSRGSPAARAEQMVFVRNVVTPAMDGSPLLLFNGCVGAGAERPEIVTGGAANAVGTSYALGTSTCIARPDVAGDVFSGDAWNFVFNVARQELRRLAERQSTLDTAPPGAPRVIWIDEPGSWFENVGSVDAPAILVFANTAGCPPLRANPTVYGIVYVDSDCDVLRWGRARIFGHVVINGNATKVTGAPRIIHWRQTGSSRALRDAFWTIATVPGTWRDF